MEYDERTLRAPQRPMRARVGAEGPEFVEGHPPGALRLLKTPLGPPVGPLTGFYRRPGAQVGESDLKPQRREKLQ